MFNTACTTPWRHPVVHFEVKMSHFRAVFQNTRRKHGGTSLKQAVSSHALRKTRTQLGPSSSLDYRAGFTLSRFYTTF